MPGKIFVNYRRDDDAGFTQALYQRLEDEFTAGALFMDVEGHIKPGDDFIDVLEAQVAQSDVLLVIIGRRWVDLLRQRENDPTDFVAIEIKAALDQGKRVIPVLVGGAAMPTSDDMPKTIRGLSRRNAVALRPERFKADCAGLTAALKESLAAVKKERAAKTAAEKVAAEDARKRSEAAESARLAAAEARAKAQASAGLSPVEIAKAEELANWDFVKTRNDAEELRDHLARFPRGVTTLYAQTALEELNWSSLGELPEIGALEDFLEEFPKGTNARAAKGKLATLKKEAKEKKAAAELKARETEEWGGVAASQEEGPIREFLENWPNGQHASAAKSRLKELQRDSGTLRRGVATGASITAGLAIVAYSVWMGANYLEFQASLYDPSVQTVDFSKRPPKAGRKFQECDTCPEMVVVPAGSFLMGSNDGGSDEKPIQVVRFAKPFAVGKFEVTFKEWDECFKAGACNQRKLPDRGWGRGERPVINVSWGDAQAYAKWLSAKTGRPYRLLTEAEWEYAARAGTTTAYFWGDKFDGSRANNNRKKTVEVGQYGANAWGLHDMHGNVWEWTEDCWNDSYNGAPTDGSAWTTGDCSRRVARGGAWDYFPGNLRSAYRNRYSSIGRADNIGFRLGRTLTP